ncbi:hypothetical protein TNCV_1411611 [Trichonephila clavipes]|nr:hypothetical protein TNCV_1411611 [Trichonephila clavipes]
MKSVAAEKFLQLRKQQKSQGVMPGYAHWTCSEWTLLYTPARPHIQDCKHIWIRNLEDDYADDSPGGDTTNTGDTNGRKQLGRPVSSPEEGALVLADV